MKLESQVCSLELAQKLKSLGVKQDCIFFWWVNPSGKAQLTHANEFGDLHKAVFEGEYAAFTVAELGEMLPASVSFTKEISSGKDNYVCIHWTPEVKEFAVYADTEADARGKMLIYLIESKLITL